MKVKQEYSRMSNFQSSLDSNLLTNSSVVNTSTSDCFLRCGSFDQIGQLNLNASARNGESFGSEINSFALFSCCGETFFNFTNLDKISLILLNLSCEICNLEHKVSEYLSSSSSKKGCEYSSSLYFLNNSLENEFFFNREKDILVSITNLIYQPSFFDLSAIPLLIFLPSSRQSLSVNSLFLVNSPSSLINSNFSSCLINSFLVTADQFIQANLSNLSTNSFCKDTVKDGIYNSPLACNFSSFISLFFNTCLATSGQFTSGNLSNFSLSSFDIENVLLIIFSFIDFTYICDCVEVCKCVSIFKPFCCETKNIKRGTYGKLTEKQKRELEAEK